MKKETIAAVFFGVLLGVTGALLLLNQARQIGSRALGNLPSAKNISPTASASKSQLQLLTDLEPKEASIFDTDKITIKGKVPKDSLVVIQSPIGEVTQVSKDGKVSSPLSLAYGENVISIVVYPKDTKTPAYQKILRVYYFEEE